MNFEYELNKQDIIDFNLFHITYAKATRRSLFIRRYVLSLSFLVLPFVFKQFSSIPFEYWLAVFIILYLYWVAFYPKRLKRIVSNRILKMLKQGKNNSVLGKHNLGISEVGIVDRSEQSEAKTQFSAIKNILEEKEHIYIYVSADSAHIIPNRIFVNEAQKNELLTFLRQRVDGTNKLL